MAMNSIMVRQKTCDGKIWGLQKTNWLRSLHKDASCFAASRATERSWICIMSDRRQMVWRSGLERGQDMVFTTAMLSKPRFHLWPKKKSLKIFAIILWNFIILMHSYQVYITKSIKSPLLIDNVSRTAFIHWNLLEMVETHKITIVVIVFWWSQIMKFDRISWKWFNLLKIQNGMTHISLSKCKRVFESLLLQLRIIPFSPTNQKETPCAKAFFL